MGIHGNSTCVMNYDEATGYLIGEENKGLKAMFTMMNEARFGVGLQGLAIGEIAYQNAVAYARERLQGRALSGPKAPGQEGRSDHRPPRCAPEPDDHPRVQRGRPRLHALGRAEIRRGAQAPRTRRPARLSDDMMGLLTPVIKGVLTDKGFEHAVMAQQMYGGHGYIEEWGMSQYVRDARIAMIYEGANGIQALDLVGRKLPA
jgi:acyl-CoA dehydrogenase